MRQVEFCLNPETSCVLSQSCDKLTSVSLLRRVEFRLNPETSCVLSQLWDKLTSVSTMRQVEFCLNPETSWRSSQWRDKLMTTCSRWDDFVFRLTGETLCRWWNDSEAVETIRWRLVADETTSRCVSMVRHFLPVRRLCSGWDNLVTPCIRWDESPASDCPQSVLNPVVSRCSDDSMCCFLGWVVSPCWLSVSTFCLSVSPTAFVSPVMITISTGTKVQFATPKVYDCSHCYRLTRNTRMLMRQSYYCAWKTMFLTYSDRYGIFGAGGPPPISEVWGW